VQSVDSSKARVRADRRAPLDDLRRDDDSVRGVEASSSAALEPIVIHDTAAGLVFYSLHRRLRAKYNLT
jgi:hypothetical protein